MPESKIVSDPKILFGKPVIAGTRISVELILEKLAFGEKIEELLIDYPHLTEHDIRAVFQFAADALRQDIVYPFANASA